MIISLGVVELPYAEDGKTTGDVAEILEDKYDVMQKFADQNIDQIAEYMADSFVGAIESRFAGAPEDFNVFGSAMANIEDRFVEYINKGEHGIITKEKSEGTGKAGARKKRQYRKNTNKIVNGRRFVRREDTKLGTLVRIEGAEEVVAEAEDESTKF